LPELTSEFSYTINIKDIKHCYCRDCGKQVINWKQKKQMHLRADHQDLDYFMPLTTFDKVPSGERAAYKNLKNHLVFGDKLISNSLNKADSHHT